MCKMANSVNYKWTEDVKDPNTVLVAYYVKYHIVS